MALIDDLNTSFARLVTDVTASLAKITDLVAQLAAAAASGGISAADAQALKDKIDAESAVVEAALAAVSPPAPPAA